MKVKEFFSFRTNKFFWLNIVAMIVTVSALIYFTLVGLDIYTRHGEAVVVPDVKGMDIDEAAMMFRNSKLKYEVSDSNYVKNKPAGCVLEVNPPIGQKVKEGRVIYLTINTLNVPLRSVPDVADNSSVRQAQAKIQAAGFKLTENEMISGDKDWVYGVKYKGTALRPGDKVPLGATLTLLVGNGADEVYGDSIDDDSEGAGESSSTNSTTEGESWF